MWSLVVVGGCWWLLVVVGGCCGSFFVCGGWKKKVVESKYFGLGMGGKGGKIMRVVSFFVFRF